jgi:FMN phosphatase YigB (HAD superfamily)
LALVARACRCELTPARLELGKELLLRYNTRTTPRPDELEYAAESIFQELLLAWELEPDGVAGAITAFFGHFSGRVRAFPEAAGVVQQLLARGMPTAVLTDVPYGMPVELLRADLVRAGLAALAQQLLSSTMVGHRKPHPAGFRMLARQLGVTCAELLFVGNEPKDIEGGKAAGCPTALVWRAAGEPPAWGQAVTVTSLDELHALV